MKSKCYSLIPELLFTYSTQYSRLLSLQSPPLSSLSQATNRINTQIKKGLEYTYVFLHSHDSST
jgi:hypothetical protein